MSKSNCKRKSCKDVFRAFLVENAHYEGYQEMPVNKESNIVPASKNQFIPFSKSMSSKDYDAWVHFYEDDYLFERVWNNPKKYLPVLKRFKGVISPDFSIYRDMPLPMQEWNTYRNRAIGHWLQTQGIEVICNVRWGDERTYDFCCNGVPHGSTIAIGSYGNIKVKRDKEYFARGLEYVVKKLSPKIIIVYGSAPNDIFKKYVDKNIKIIKVDSLFSSTRRKR